MCCGYNFFFGLVFDCLLQNLRWGFGTGNRMKTPSAISWLGRRRCNFNRSLNATGRGTLSLRRWREQCRYLICLYTTRLNTKQRMTEKEILSRFSGGGRDFLTDFIGFWISQLIYLLLILFFLLLTRLCCVFINWTKLNRKNHWIHCLHRRTRYALVGLSMRSTHTHTTTHCLHRNWRAADRVVGNGAVCTIVEWKEQMIEIE